MNQSKQEVEEEFQVQQMEQEKIEKEECQSDYQKKILQIRKEQDWKSFVSMLQDEDFCKVLSIPHFWRQNESIQIFSHNPNILPKILELLDLQQMKQGFQYLEQIQLWFNLISQTSNMVEEQRNRIEQIIGSCLQKQLLQFLEYKAYLKQAHQAEFEKMTQNIQKIQFKQLENFDYTELDSPFWLLYTVQTKVIDKQTLENYLKKVFNQTQQQLNYEQLQSQIIEISIQSINIEELYFIITFYFLNQYCMQFDFQTEYKELEDDLIKLKGQLDNQQSIIGNLITKAATIPDQNYQFLYNQLISQGQEVVNQQILDSYSKYIENQNLIEKQLLQSQYVKLELLGFQNVESFVQAFPILQKVPLIRLRKVFSQDAKISAKILLLSLLRQENLSSIYQLIESSQNLNLFQCSQLLQENSAQFQNQESILTLFLLISIIRQHSYVELSLLYKLFKIEKSFSRAQLIQNILTLSDAMVNLNEHHLQNTELHKYDLKDWQIIKQVFIYQKISLLLKRLFNIYSQQDDKQRLIIYQILKNLNSSNILEGDEAEGLQFLLNPSITKQIFDVLLLKDLTLLKNPEFLKLFSTSLLLVLETKTVETRQSILNWLREIDKNSLYQFDLLINLLGQGKDSKIVQQIWEVYINFASQNTEALYAMCSVLYNQDPILYKECFSNQNYFGLSDLTYEFFQGKDEGKDDCTLIKQQANYNQTEQEENKNKNQNQVIDEEFEDQTNDEINNDALEQLNNILVDIQEELLVEEEEIVNEIIPYFNQLNQKNQNKFKLRLQEEFQGFSFIKNNLFKVEVCQSIEQNFQQIYQNLCHEKNWKTLLNQFQNKNFCLENQIPQFWSSKECIKIFQNNEQILENSLKLVDLNKIENGFKYIEVIEILLLFLADLNKEEQDGTIIAQIVGSTLKVQILQFQEYKQSLKLIDQNKYINMVQDIQKYQMKQNNEIKIEDYDKRFEIFIKCCIIQWSQQEINLIINKIFDNNLSVSKLAQNIQNFLIEGKLIEECYFYLVFFYYTQYCNLFNYSKEKLQLGDQLTKLKESKERQLTQLKRITKKFIDLKDEILQFIVSTSLYLSEGSIDIVSFQQLQTQFDQQQNFCERDLQPYFKQTFEEMLRSKQSFEAIITHSKFLSMIKANQIFQQDQQIGNKFLLLNYLKAYEINIQEMSISKQYFQLLENFFKKTRNQELTIYIFILVNKMHKFADPKPLNYVSLFRKENSFNKASFIRDLQNLTVGNIPLRNTFKEMNQIIQNLSKLNRNDWLLMEEIFGRSKMEFTYQLFYDIYLKCKMENQLKKQLYQLLKKACCVIRTDSRPSLISSKILIIYLPQQVFNFFVLQSQKKQINLPEKVFQITLIIIYCLLLKLNQNQQQDMLSLMQSLFNNKYFQFVKMKELLSQQKIEMKLIYQYQIIMYCNEIKSYEKLQELAFNFFLKDCNHYQQLFEEKNYFNLFQIQPRFLRNKQTQKLYPTKCEIVLEDFNISLSELKQEDKQKLVNGWLQNMTDTKNFRELIPLYFNVIKRKEHPRNLLSLLNNNNNFKFNMKAMFQILYNNSNHELKSMLLKLWCTIYPIPFLYSNCNIQSIKNQKDIYCLNEKLIFIFPDCFPILNLSLSKQQNSYGKTSLINRVFYQADVFEVSDKNQLNENTIDIMFDFCFSGSRNLAVADIHGEVPFDVLIKLLPLFKLWIIQMDSEEELAENYQKLQDIKKNVLCQQCCFLVRNSKGKQNPEKSQLEQQIEKEGVVIHKIIDFTEKGLDQQTINAEHEKFSKCIFSIIQKNLDKKRLSNLDDFYKILLNYYGEQHSEILQIKKDNKILQDLNAELNKYLQDPFGFYSLNAFPMRSLQWQIKNSKQEQYKFDGLSKDEQMAQVERKKQEISTLEKQIPFVQPTKLLVLFEEIFQSQEYYILYLKFTDQIRRFNELNTYNLQEENQIINENLQKKKQEKKKRMQQNQNQKDIKQKQESDEIKALKKKLEQNLKVIEFRNIGIELFWREIISIKQKGQSTRLQINPAEIVAKMVKKGEPFEFLDGDQLQIDQKFLLEFIKQYSDPDNEKVLVLSILGPQSSGKSTILNKIFGCHFWTSVGRCTKGIYLQLLKITQKSYFDDKFDYVLILDSEGLQNPNQNDPEFDKKIALFILAISDIILINVKGDIHSQFKNLVEMCIFTLGQMKSSISAVKQLSWCFNQNNDCKNFAPFLQQIQGIVNTLNLEINKADDEGDTQSFDYNEVLDLKKESIKILGFASTEQSWRINPNTGIYEEWRQQLVNETFSEEAYSFGIQMILQYVQKHNAEQNYHLPSLFQFIQNIESTWQSICRLPDLLEFTELLQYKHDQFMKAQYESIYQKYPYDYQMQIPSKIQAIVLKEKKKNLEFFKKIEDDEKKFIEQEKEKIKIQIEEELQKFKQEQQIQNKICKKYIRILGESLQTYEYNCHLTLFDEIKKHEHEFQQKKGFTQIEDLVAKISQDSEQLKKLKGQKPLIEAKFNEIWSKISQQSIQQQDKVFYDFSRAQYQAIYSSFAQYQYKSTNQENYQNLFFEISKQPPKQDSIQEKELIFDLYFQEIMNQQQFQIIGSHTQNIKYNDIFHQSLHDRLKKSKKNHVIDINDFYSCQSTVYYISINEFNQYIIGDSLYKDFSQFMKKDKEYSNSQKYSREKLVNTYFQEFFCILHYCQITYSKEKFEKLRQHAIEGGSWYKFGLDTKSHFEDFQKTFILPVSKFEIITTQEFTRNMKQIYPSLKLQSKQFNGKNEIEIENLYKQNNSEIQFLLQNSILLQSDTPDVFFYIADQQQHSNGLSNFYKNIQKYFFKIMEKKQGWQKIYYRIYDIIKQKMSHLKRRSQENQIENDSENEEILSSDNYLIKQIMSIIEQQIIDYNKQFANFGIILSLIGERCINYYSIFIIWRFSCYSKWRQLEENNLKLQQMKPEQLKKFIAEIEQNKREQSILNAQALAKNIKLGFLERFYQDQLQKVSDSINRINKTSNELIKQLDQGLLLNFQQAQQFKVSEKEILSYILDQKSYIQKYVDDLVQNKEEEIHKEYEAKLRSELYEFLKLIFRNVSLIYSITKQQVQELKSEKYFEINDNELNQNQDCENLLFLFISRCIQGEQFNKEENNQKISNQQKEIFEQKYEQIKIPIFVKIQNESEKKIPLLKPFIEELYKQLENEINTSIKEPLIIKNLRIQESLNKIKLNMYGCLHTCPMCKRKCDQPSDPNHRHTCTNGHQYRGMNGVLIDNWPSLFTCEEIDDNALITTFETNKEQKWKDIKKAYSEWNFSDLSLEKMQELKQKMMDIWNSGAGQFICNELTNKMNKTVTFEKKTELNQVKQSYRPTHYILMLDDSGSMGGKPWENAKNGALSCMKDISKNGEARVSVVIFNFKARCVIDCQKVDIDKQKDLITFNGGGTSFNEAFLLAYDQVTKHFNKNFEKNVILFYTDGGDSFPSQAVDKFCKLNLNQRQKIQLISCAEGNQNASLVQITDQFTKESISAELKSNIKVEHLTKVWTEVVTQSYHQLRQ